MLKIKRIYKRIILLSVILIIFGGMAMLFLLSGKIVTRIKDDNLEISMYYLGTKPVSQTIIYNISDFEIIFFENHFEEGEKISGESLVFVKYGRYDSDVRGEYVLYRYKKTKSVIILKNDDLIYVLNAKNDKQTKSLHDRLIACQK